MGCHFLLQGIFLTQGLSLCLLHCRQFLYHWATRETHANKVMLKILQASLQQSLNQELPDIQAGFRKGRGTRNQLANICCIIEKFQRKFQKNIYFCFIDCSNAFDCVDHNKLRKILRDGNTRPLYLPPWETCMLLKKQQMEPYMEQLTGSKLGEWYDKAVYCHPVYLISMQSTSCEMPGWMNPMLESRLLGEITSDRQIIPF